MGKMGTRKHATKYEENIVYFWGTGISEIKHLNLGNIDFGDKRDLFLGNKETKRFILEKQANESPK